MLVRPAGSQVDMINTHELNKGMLKIAGRILLGTLFLIDLFNGS